MQEEANKLDNNNNNLVCIFNKLQGIIKYAILN